MIKAMTMALRLGDRPSSRSAAMWLAVAGLGLLAVITGATVSLIDHFRERALLGAERELSNTVGILGRHFDEQFRDSATIASDLIRRLGIARFSSAEELRMQLGGEHARTLMRSQGVSYLGDVSIFDIDGNLVNWSHPSPMPKLNIAARDYFKRFLTDSSAPDVMTETVPSLLTGKWHVAIAQRLRGANDIFVGVLVRRIDLLQFERFFGLVSPGSSTAISLFRSDGTLLARHPAAPDAIGKKFNTSAIALLRAEPDRPTVRGPGALDGLERLAAGVSLEHIPAILIASETVEAALEDWQLQMRATLLAAASISLVVAVVLGMIIRQIMREARDGRRRLERERERLDTALNNMIQGLVVYDRDGIVVSINRSFFEMFGLDPTISVIGWSFRDLIEERKRLGHFESDVDAFCSEVRNGISAGRLVAMESITADGRSYLALNRPLRDGGWVSTIENSTERTKLEQERDRNLAFLHEIIDHIPSLITVKDVSTRRYLLANHNAERYFGVERGRIVGQTVLDILPAAEAAFIEEQEDRLITSQENVLRGERSFVSQTGKDRFLKSTRVAIRDAGGFARYIVSVYEDVTARKLADDRVTHLAHYDALTDLPNRVYFRAQMEELWREPDRARGAALL
jgi:PAS domain S-box-containing protein